MMLLALTTAIAVAYGIGSGRYERALAIGAITPAGAAVVAAGEALPTFYATALGGFGLIAWQWLRRRGAPVEPRLAAIPGVPLLLIMLAWAAVVVVVAPMLFPGTRSVTEAGWRLVAGDVNMSNIAQLAYFGLSIVVIVIIARAPGAGPSLLAIPLGVSMALSLWRYLSINVGVPFPEGMFSNSPSFHYIETAPGGVARFRGIYAEPSGLAVATVVSASYGIAFAARTRGGRRVASVALAAVAIFLGSVSTSTTFTVAGSVMAGLAVLVLGARLLAGRLRVSHRAALLGVGVIAVGVLLLPTIIGNVSDEVGEKVGSTSFDTRAGADARALDIFLDTWGMGIGLGSVRASSFLYTMLGAVGLVGLVLFALAVLSIIVPALRLPDHAPVVWAVTAALVVKGISSPDLADSSGILWIGLGILARGVVVAAARARERSAEAAPT